MRILIALALAVVAAAAQAAPSDIVAQCARAQGVSGPVAVQSGFVGGRSYARVDAGGNIPLNTAQAVNACAARHGVNTGAGTVPVASERRHLSVFCPYPYRPSDSAFLGGAGYLTKDQVRRRNGCL